MPTLDELLGKNKPGDIVTDGRKFVAEFWEVPGGWFQPIFRTEDGTGTWVGLDHMNVVVSLYAMADGWQEYTETPKTKKVKVYRPILWLPGVGAFGRGYNWFLSKTAAGADFEHTNIVGWDEDEITING